jgi:hypothetical protein
MNTTWQYKGVYYGYSEDSSTGARTYYQLVNGIWVQVYQLPPGAPVGVGGPIDHGSTALVVGLSVVALTIGRKRGGGGRRRVSGRRRVAKR